VLKHGSLRDPISLLSSLALSFFYFCLSSILICKNFRDPFQAFFALYFSLVVQFSKIICQRAIGVPTFLLYHIGSALSIPFSKLFSSFFKSFSPSARPIPYPPSPLPR
ncbi:MAG: hypothetical protein IKJ35_00725, partial [Clostridia bacterium]|nr:hypothetical protein [Clostridia bacterium]